MLASELKATLQLIDVSAFTAVLVFTVLLEDALLSPDCCLPPGTLDGSSFNSIHLLATDSNSTTEGRAMIFPSPTCQ